MGCPGGGTREWPGVFICDIVSMHVCRPSSEQQRGDGFDSTLCEGNRQHHPLEVDEVAELTAGAESWLTVAECCLTALGHVLMGPAEAYNA